MHASTHGMKSMMKNKSTCDACVDMTRLGNTVKSYKQERMPAALQNSDPNLQWNDEQRG